MKKHLMQKGFSCEWKSIHVEPATLQGEFYGPRSWQKKAFQEFREKTYSIINAPMGSGKSWLMCLLSAYKLQKDPNLRCIIAVPQTIIAPGFEEANLLMPETNKELRWFAQHDMCKEIPSEGTINAVIQFLKGPHAFLQDKVLLCTHATIIAVYKRLQKKKQLGLLHDLVCWIDEAHHLKNYLVEGLEDIEDIEDATISNGIGQLVKHLTKYGKNVHLGLVTASFFRGDRLSLLTPKMEEKFVRFNLPYDDYLESMKYLRSFSFDFLLSGPDFIKGIRTLLKKRIGKDIIYIPPPNSRHALDCKYHTCDQIIEAYRKEFGGKRVDRGDGVTILRRKDGKELKILDLVQEKLRKNKKAFVGQIKNKDDLDVIIALGMFKEGANWIWADRAIIVGARSSLLDEFQMIGRLFRDAKGKKHVEVVQLLPFSLDQTDSEKFRKNLNNYLKAIYASLILENIFNPVKIKIPKGEMKKNGKFTKSVDWLSEMLPNDTSKVSLIEEVSNALMYLVGTPSTEPINLREEYNSVLPDILESYGIKKHINKINEQIWGMFTKRTLSLSCTSIDDIDFDILKQVSPIDFITKYTSGACNVNTFRKLRSIIGVHNNKKYKHSEVVKLFSNHGATLLENTYMNAHTPMKYKCKCGKEATKTLTKWLTGSKQCAKCSGSIVEHHEVVNAFESEGYQLLSKYYKCNIPLDFVCPNGHKRNITWTSFALGHRCNKCSGNYQRTYEEVYKLFKYQGCTLLSASYVHSKTPMKYKCECGNISTIALSNFMQGKRCKKCAPQRINSTRKQNIQNKKQSIFYSHPTIAKRWHPTKNSIDIQHATKGSMKWAWWVCDNGHEYRQRIGKAIREGCPICSGKRVSIDTAVATKYPLVIDIWHKKNSKSPYYYTAGSNKKVWWQCPKHKDHEWEQSPAKIVQSLKRGTVGCPYCHGKKVAPSNSLATLRPNLVQEWHPKNSIKPNEVTVSSNRKVKWKCSKGHEWTTPISQRTNRGHGCPHCWSIRRCK